MVIERRIRINNRYYYLGVELKYSKGKLLTRLDGVNFDMGDLSVMIRYVEKKYKTESKELIYDQDISYMNDILYLYDRFPFVSYIKDVSYDIDGNMVLLGSINRDEIINYLETNNIQINRWDKDSCPCPLLYK